MINIEKFVQIRKDQKLSQTDLCMVFVRNLL